MTECSIRMAKPEDMPRLRELHTELQQRTSLKLELPEFWLQTSAGDWVLDGAFLGVWVVERGGEVINAFYLEKTIELCLMGPHPMGTAAIIAEQNIFLAVMQQAGFRVVHSEIPADLEEAIAPHLIDQQFATQGLKHYQARLR